MKIIANKTQIWDFKLVLDLKSHPIYWPSFIYKTKYNLLKNLIFVSVVALCDDGKRLLLH